MLNKKKNGQFAVKDSQRRKATAVLENRIGRSRGVLSNRRSAQIRHYTIPVLVINQREEDNLASWGLRRRERKSSWFWEVGTKKRCKMMLSFIKACESDWEQDPCRFQERVKAMLSKRRRPKSFGWWRQKTQGRYPAPRSPWWQYQPVILKAPSIHKRLLR